MITSTSNPKVKHLVNLRKKRKARDEEGVFLVEGIRMFREVPAEDLKEVYVTESFLEKEKDTVHMVLDNSGVIPEVFADHVFSYASDTKTPQGVLCAVRQRKQELKAKEQYTGKNGEAPFVLLLDNIQDPGNLGTMIRTAEAAGVTGVIMSSDCVDIYNPKTIRSTMGSVYRVPFWDTEDVPAAVRAMKEQGIRTYAAHLEGKSAYEEEDYRGPCAFFVGNEGNGLRKEIAELADAYVKIPMCGKVESLNASVAAAVLMFEGSRQRRGK